MGGRRRKSVLRRRPFCRRADPKRRRVACVPEVLPMAASAATVFAAIAFGASGIAEPPGKGFRRFIPASAYRTQETHFALPCCGLPGSESAEFKTSFAKKYLPSLGTIMIWILSESRSAIIFWISNGFS